MTPQGPQGSGNASSTGDHVVDFNEARAQKLEEKRRKTERIFFKQLLGVYSVVGHGAMAPIEMVDVSEDGCSFQIPFNPNKPWPTDLAEVPIRIYFSQDSYLEILVQIQHSRPSIENGTRYTRFGCKIDAAIAAYPAWQQFVKFLRLYSEHCHKDMGDISVFYL
jgi:hypothetical protein